MKIKLWLLDTWHSCSFIIRSICFHHGFHVHLPTGLNLQTIRDPHHETRMDRSRCCFMLVVPLLFAFLPWLPLKCGYFVPEVWFPNHFFKTDTISKDNLITIANQVSDTKSTLQSWFKVKETISYKFRYNTIKAEFGFYSRTSVCMPRFYASTRESSWEYSTFLITLDFILFIFMVVIYILVYKKVSAMSISTSTKKDPNKGMQKRISRLLLTDFFCWIPVCIMAYLSVAGVSLPSDAYIASAGLLLPINSAMNPLLYSKLVDQYMSPGRKWVVNNLLSICPRHVEDSATAEGTREHVELEVIHSSKQWLLSLIIAILDIILIHWLFLPLTDKVMRDQISFSLP